MFEVSVRARFSAAHRLSGYPGKCAAFHGHNWDVEVFVRGRRLDRTGILLDFRALKEHVAGVLKDIDHADLNALPEFRQRNPTSENIARLLYRRISSAVDGRGYRVTRVSVHETPETTATYWED